MTDRVQAVDAFSKNQMTRFELWIEHRISKFEKDKSE